MAVATLPKIDVGPSIEDRMNLAKKANEEIGALIAVCKQLPRLDLDECQKEIAVRGMMARIEQISDIAWAVLADAPENFKELNDQVEFLGPV